MRRLLLPLALTLLIATPASAGAAGEIFTLAGTGTSGPVSEGGAAIRAGLDSDASIAPLPDGGFLVGDDGVVRRVDAQGRIHTVAGSGRSGSGGDGGPALQARFAVSGLAALPGGGFLIADGVHGRVRMVDPAGVITTVAGGGSSFKGEDIPATQAQLAGPISVAVLPGGGFVIADADAARVRKVGPDGLIHTLAGNGETAHEIVPLHGQPATSVPVTLADVAVAADGTLLIADYWAGRVDRVAADGAITVAVSGTPKHWMSPYGVSALPDGGFLIADNGEANEGADAHVWRAAPDGTLTAIAGSGRFVPTAPTGLEHRGDGGGALAADLQFLRDAKPMPDGGVLFSEGTEDLVRDDVGSLVRYVAPAAPGVLAASLLRDRDRVFRPGRPAAVSVASSLPATVTLAVDGRTTTASVPAGTSRVALPAALSGGRPRRVALVASDAAGRRAEDAVRLYPAGWLADETARLVAGGIAFTVLRADSIGADGILSCRRFGAARVDCAMAAQGRRCTVVASVSLAQGRLRWGTYRCGLRSHPRYTRRPRALRTGDWSCDEADTDCPPPLFGKVDEAALVPSG